MAESAVIESAVMDSAAHELAGEGTSVSWEESERPPSREESVLKSSVDQERGGAGLAGRGPAAPPCDAEETKILGGAPPQPRWNLEDLSFTLLP